VHPKDILIQRTVSVDARHYIKIRLITAGVLSEPSGKVGKQYPLLILSVLRSEFDEYLTFVK
jgi:hypothetical protein